MHLDDNLMLLTVYLEKFHWHILLNWKLHGCKIVDTPKDYIPTHETLSTRYFTNDKLRKRKLTHDTLKKRYLTHDTLRKRYTAH